MRHDSAGGDRVVEVIPDRALKCLAMSYRGAPPAGAFRPPFRAPALSRARTPWPFTTRALLGDFSRTPSACPRAWLPESYPGHGEWEVDGARNNGIPVA